MQNKYQAQNQDPKGNSREQPSILKTVDIVSSQLSFAERDKLTHLITHTEEQSNMTMLFDSVFQINTPNTQNTSISKKNKHRRHLLLARSKKKMQDDEEDEIVFTQNLSTAVRGYAISPKFFMKDDPTSFTSSFSFQSVEDKQSSQAEQDNKTFQFGTPENDNKKDSAGPRRRLTAKRRLKPTQMRINQPENVTRIQNAGNSSKTGEQSVSTGITISTERNKLKPPTTRTSPKYDGSTLALGNGVAVGAVTKSNTENIDDNIPVLQPSLKRSKRKKDQAFSTNCDHEDMPSYIETERNSPNQQASREYSQKSHYSSQTRSRSILGAIDARMNAMGLGMRQTIQHSAIKYNHSQGRALSPSTLPVRDLDTHMNNDQKTAKSLASLSTYKHTSSAANHSNADSHNHGPPQKDAWQQIIPLSRNLANEDKEQRQKFMNFWINLSDQQRRDLLKIDKESVLRKIKEQQRRTCSCNVCGRRRSAVERELEMLYDAYCREIQTQSTNLERTTNRSSGSDIEENTLETEDSEDLDIGKSLRVKGNLLTLDDDMIKYKGRKFLLLLDRLNSLERRLSSFAKIDDNNQAFESSGQSESGLGTLDNDGAMNKSKMDSEIDDDSAEQHSDDNVSDTNSEEDVGHDENPTDRDSDTEGEIDSDSDISLATEQRIKEGRKMFQMFAAKMFEQRAYAAFKEVMAFHNQQKLIQEEEDAVRQQQAKKDAKSKKAKQKKQRKKQQKQLAEQAKKQQEEEERQQQEQQKKLKEEQEKMERDRRRQVEEIQRKERERLQAEKLQKIAQQKEKEKKKQQLKQEKEKIEISNNSLPTVTQTKKKKKKKNTVGQNQASSEPVVSTVQQPIVSKQNLKNQANKSKKIPSKLNPNAAPYTVGRTTDKSILSNAPSSHVDDEDDDIANLLQNLIPAKLTLEDSASALGSSQDSWLLDEHADSLKMKFDPVASQNKTDLDETSQSSPDHNTASQWTTSEHVNIPSFLPVYSFPPAHVTNEQTWPQDTGVSLWTAKDTHPPNNHVNFAAWTPTWQGNLTGNSFTPSIVEKHFHFQPS